MEYCARPHDQGQWDYSRKGFMFRMFTVSVTFPIIKLTVPLSFTFVIVYGPFQGSSLNFESIAFFCTGLSHSLNNDALFVKRFLLYCFYQ
jgi:hypothetical protein